MQYASLERWEKVTHISIAFAWVVAALFGIAGYATFQALSQGLSSKRAVHIDFTFIFIVDGIFIDFKSFSGDLLENYCWNDDLMNFARVLFSVSILLTFPIECFVSREVRVMKPYFAIK